MSYRRPSNTGPESSRWRLRHKRFLLDCGVPQQVLDSDDSWIYVLLHGADEFGTGWDATWITAEQARRLLRFLERELEATSPFDLVRVLKRRLEQEDA